MSTTLSNRIGAALNHKEEALLMLDKVRNPIAASAFFVLSFAAAALTQALPAPDLVKGGSLWTVTAFDDSSPTHTQLATQSICFEFVGVVGTHVRYRWRSTTFPDWNGIASQEGDQIFMHGDYARDIGHDGMMWSLDTARSGSGHWTEWREDGGFGRSIAFANAEFQRVGNCPVFGLSLPVIAPQYFADGTLVETPMGLPLEKDKD